jgi:hypothetical protein
VLPIVSVPNCTPARMLHAAGGSCCAASATMASKLGSAISRSPLATSRRRCRHVSDPAARRFPEARGRRPRWPSLARLDHRRRQDVLPDPGTSAERLPADTSVRYSLDRYARRQPASQISPADPWASSALATSASAGSVGGCNEARSKPTALTDGAVGARDCRSRRDRDRRRFVGFVEIEPNGDVLPVRARYGDKQQLGHRRQPALSRPRRREDPLLASAALVLD